MSKWKQAALSAKQKASGAALAAGVAMVPALTWAQTADPGAAVFSEMETKAATYITAGFALLVVVLAGTVGMKLVKKILNRAT